MNEIDKEKFPLHLVTNLPVHYISQFSVLKNFFPHNVETQQKAIRACVKHYKSPKKIFIDRIFILA